MNEKEKTEDKETALNPVNTLFARTRFLGFSWFVNKQQANLLLTKIVFVPISAHISERICPVLGL